MRTGDVRRRLYKKIQRLKRAIAETPANNRKMQGDLRRKYESARIKYNTILSQSEKPTKVRTPLDILNKNENEHSSSEQNVNA